MSDKKSNFFSGSFSVISSFALSVAASYAATMMTIKDWFNFPLDVYIAILIVIGILLVYQGIRMLRFFIVRNRDSKQKSYTSYHGWSGKQRNDVELPFSHANLKWEVVANVQRQTIEDVSSPFCPQDNCETALNTYKTYWGKYLYQCPNCSFKEKKVLKVETLQNNVKKIVEAQIKRELKAENRK